MRAKTVKIGEFKIPSQHVFLVFQGKLEIKGQVAGDDMHPTIAGLKGLPTGVAYEVVAQDTRSGKDCSGAYELKHCDFKQSTTTAGSVVTSFRCELQSVT